MPKLVLCLYTTCFLNSALKPGGFLDSSVGKESPCKAGDPSSILGLGRSSGEGIGYLLQYSLASLVAQLVKNSPAMQETWVWSRLGRSPGEGKGYQLQYSCLENFTEYSPWGRKESDMIERLSINQAINHSWFQFVLHSAQHFTWCILQIS